MVSSTVWFVGAVNEEPFSSHVLLYLTHQEGTKYPICFFFFMIFCLTESADIISCLWGLIDLHRFPLRSMSYSIFIELYLVLMGLKYGFRPACAIK